jgi:drug/metabolite transporter (DMT)-like permease
MTESQTVALPQPRGSINTDLLLLTMTLIWGVNYSAIKIALGSMPPFVFNVFRFGLATLIMVILLWRRGENLRVARRDILAMIVIGLTGHGIYQILFIGGLARTTPANSALILASMPIWVAVYGVILGTERANRTTWAGITLSFVGIVLLIVGGGKALSLEGSSLIGDLMTLAAAMLWAVFVTISKPLLVRYSPVKVTTIEMLIGTPILILVGLPGLLNQDWQQVPPVAWGCVLYSAVLATVVAYVLWTTGVQRTGSARTAIYSNVTPIAAMVAAWLILGDKLQPGQLAGAAIVLAGLMLTRRGKRS